MKIFILLLALSLTLACSNLSKSPKKETTASSVPASHSIITASDVLDIKSEYTNKDYQIIVNLPPSYETNKDKSYPVIYILDSQWQYPLIYSLIGAITYERDMPEVILVGITWKPSEKGLMALRNEDLTPTKIKTEPQSGQAIQFLSFLKHELMVQIDQRYRVNGHRTLTGGSSSALFSIYALFTDPELIDAYIASSPSITWDNGVMFTYLKEFENKDLPKEARLYISRGELEPSIAVDQFANDLKNLNKKNLTIEYQVVRRAGHASVNAETYNRGIQFAYQPPEAQVSAQVLLRHAGKYKNDKGDEINLGFIDNKLVRIYKNGSQLPLNPLSNSHFYIKANAEEYIFNSNRDENTESLIWSSFWYQTQLSRVKED